MVYYSDKDIDELLEEWNRLGIRDTNLAISLR